MKKHTKIKGMLLTLASLLSLTACEDKEEMMQFEFVSTIEQMQSDNNAKVHLVNEEWIYWEPNDKISISSDTWTGTPSMGYLTGSGGQYEDYNGTFLSELTWDSKYFLGLHPYSDQNVITHSGTKADFSTIKLLVPTTQGYRNDVSFATDVIPMVAWYGGEWDDKPHSEAFNLNFRAMAAIVRLQFYNATEGQHNITSITVEEVSDTPKPLTGLFPVLNYKTYDPFLDKNVSNIENVGYTITLQMPGGSLPFMKDSLRSFYLVLPAVAHRDVTTDYKLRVTVNTTDGHFTKDVSVHTRRNGITYLRAIGITSLTAGEWDVEPGLVGNGTEERPFKIYTLADLTHLRDCFNNPRTGGDVYINGQKVTANTWFRIMRSDIILNKTNWTTGINNFTGHMTYYSNAARTTHGITNRSCVPLFNSIGTYGHVKGLAIVTDSLINLSTDAHVDTLDYSPLCHTNKGTIENCRNISNTISTDDNKRFYGKPGGVSTYAGICVMNKGTIIGSDCGVIRILHNNSDFGGICKNNQGTIKGCILSSPASIAGSGGDRGGICLTNEGVVQDCYTDISYNNFTDAANWGGIVYNNQNGASHIVKNCYMSANAILRANGTVGGIVNTNGGIVDYCYVETHALSGNNVGGIVANLNGGEVRNCFIDDSSLFITLRTVGGAHYAGGIVATQSGGSITNCYALLKHFVVSSSDATGIYGTLVGHMTTTSATVNNCYTLEVDATTPQFYGTKTNGTLTNCHLVGGTQADVNDCITTVDNTTLGTLLSSLNSNRGTNGYEWTRGSTPSAHSAPSLKAPTATKYRHR